MQTPRPHDETWSEEELLEWILNKRARRATPREQLLGEPANAERLEQLEALVQHCRSALSDEQVISPSRSLADSILARTTREELGLAGDLRLVVAFVSQRISSSVLLRVVAASLLLHIAALPVLAYFTFFAGPRQKTLITMERFGALEALPYASAESEPEPRVEIPKIDIDPASLPPAAVLFARHRAQAGLGAMPRGDDPAVVWADDLGLVLWCEQQLDGAPSGKAPGKPAPRLSFALEHLEQLLGEGPLGEDAASRAPLLRLARSAWLRAEAAGLTHSGAPLEGTDAGLLRGDAWAEVYSQVVSQEQ
jgi:hypothetical protein